VTVLRFLQRPKSPKSKARLDHGDASASGELSVYICFSAFCEDVVGLKASLEARGVRTWHIPENDDDGPPSSADRPADRIDACDVVVAPIASDRQLSSSAMLGELHLAAGHDGRQGRAAKPIFLTGEPDAWRDNYLHDALGYQPVYLPADPEHAADVLVAAAHRQRG
jgi:hypothetical protein